MFYDEIKQMLSKDKILFNYNIINFGGKFVYIDGFTKLVDVNRENITLLLKNNKITVKGENLLIREMIGNTIIIEGVIYATIKE